MYISGTLFDLNPKTNKGPYIRYVHVENYMSYVLYCKGRGKVHPRTGHEDTDMEKSYSCTLSLTLSLDGVSGQRHAPAALPWELSGTHCIGGWGGGGSMGRSGQMWKISPPTGIRSPDRRARSGLLYRLSYPGPHLYILYITL
jgi:hypothetical protein